MKFSILNSELKAAMLFASDDESRFVLNGVHVEVTAGKQPILVATNGRALCVIQSEAVQDPTSGPSATFILSASFLRKICPFSKSKLFPFITFEPHPPKRMFCTTMDPKCFIDCEEGALIEGDYPNWRQTLPCGEKEQVKNVGFSGEFLSDFTKAAIALGANPFLRLNLYSATSAMDVLIDGKPGFYGVLMPLKAEDPTTWQPEFIGLTPRKITQEAK